MRHTTNPNTSLTLPFQVVHDLENNPASQLHLDQYRDRFNAQCWDVLTRMLNGERLSSKSAINTGIGDIRRRAKDLIDNYGIPVQRRWAEIKGVKQHYKEYYIEVADKQAAMLKIINSIKSAA